MISRVRLLRNVGQFDSVDAGAAIQLARFVLVHAENGRGKTTLAAILRSLALGDPTPINERRRLASLSPPHIVLDCSIEDGPVIFQNGAWNHPFPEMAIFDDRFVDENVYSGLTVAASHRQNLHEVVIGAEGVALNRQLQALVRRIEAHNSDLRTLAAEIPAALRGPFSVDEFCDLVVPEDIDEQIRFGERELAAAQEQDSIRNYPLLDEIELPEFNLVTIVRTLELDLAGLEAAAARSVQQHFAQLGAGGEAWVADGMRRIPTSSQNGELCPFCAQALENSEILSHYRAYFGREYANLRQNISRTLSDFTNHHTRDVPVRLERTLRMTSERLQFWSRFCEVRPVGFDPEPIIREWQASRDGIITALETKRNAPLDRVPLQEVVMESISRFDSLRTELGAFNVELQHANERISTVKRSVQAGNANAVRAKLERYVAMRRRGAPEVEVRCAAYIAARRAKRVTEESRDNAQERLDLYRAAAFPRCQHALNHYLNRFGAGFRIQGVSAIDNRGGPACNYNLIINNAAVPVDGGTIGTGEPAFKNTLSSGDRNTLAMSFFLSSIDPDPDVPNPQLARKVVAVDDPVSSFDDHRIFTTVQELRRLGTRVRQLIILSHDRKFLCKVWQGIDQANSTAIRIERSANGSTIVPWDVSDDCVTEHDRNHCLLRSYLRNPAGHDRRQVASALRPMLEGFLRVARPQEFPPLPRILHRFLRDCQDRVDTPQEILDARDTRELREIVEYADLFHHETNPAWETIVISDGELQQFVTRVLDFATR